MTLKLKIITLMLGFLLAAVAILYGASLLAEWAAAASKADQYNIRVRVLTHGEVER